MMPNKCVMFARKKNVGWDGFRFAPASPYTGVIREKGAKIE